MLFSMKSFSIIFVGFFSSFLAVYPGIAIARQFKLIDLPSSQHHKVHPRPTLLAGGFAIVIGVVVFSFVYHNEFELLITPYSILATVIIFFTGVIDDKYNLKPYQKMIGQIISSIILILGGFHTTIFQSYPIIDILITLLWYVGIINAFNFLDSSDGILLGIGLTITGALIIFTNLSGQTNIQLFCIGFFGIQAGVLYFNSSPAKLFLGDSGSQVIGMILAILTLMYNPLGNDKYSSWIMPILMMYIPIFDVTMVVYTRLRKRVPVYVGGLDHTFHRLKSMGLSTLQANSVVIFLVLITNLIAFVSLKAYRLIAYFTLGLVLIVGFFGIRYFEKTGEPDSQ